jgi:hypothetical protein
MTSQICTENPRLDRRRARCEFRDDLTRFSHMELGLSHGIACVSDTAARAVEALYQRSSAGDARRLQRAALLGVDERLLAGDADAIEADVVGGTLPLSASIEVVVAHLTTYPPIGRLRQLCANDTLTRASMSR